MRHIKIDELVRLVDPSELDEASKAISLLDTEAEKKEYIENNSNKWSNIRSALWQLGNMKCWYSEDRIQEGEGEVEHYRPKGNVCKSKHKGYWWLAFDWHNYRLSHPTCNKRRTDFLTKKKAGKGMYFPLKDESLRAYNSTDIKNEEPVLLDPTNASDVKLICYNLFSGKPEYSPYCNSDSWKMNRVEETIGYYHLDEGTWNKNRFDIAKAVDSLCKKINEAKSKGDDSEVDNLTSSLKNEYVNEFASFYSVALQVIIENGLYEII